METTIEKLNELLLKNENIFNQSYNKLFEMNNQIEVDLNNLTNLANSIPKELMNHDKSEICNLLRTVEINSFANESEVNYINQRMTAMQYETTQYLSVLKDQKGAVALSRDKIIEKTDYHIKTLNSAITHVRESMATLKSLIENIKSHCGLGSVSKDIIENLIREMLQSILPDEFNKLKYEVAHMIKDNIPVKQNDTKSAGDVTHLQLKLNEHGDSLTSVKLAIDEKLKRLKDDVTNLTMHVNQLRQDDKKDQLKKITTKVENDIESLKSDTHSRIKNLEKIISQNTFKRFIQS